MNSQINNKTSANSLQLNNVEKTKVYLKKYVLFFGVGMIFYRNILLSFIAGFFSIPISKLKIKSIEKEKIREILKEFRDFLNIYLAASLTGDEPFSAFKFAYNEFKKSENFKSILVYKLEEVINRTEVNMNFLKNLQELSSELKIKEIDVFVKCADVAMHFAGNMEEILMETIDVITNKLECDNEIMKMFYEKRYELKIMIFVPILIFTFLSLTAKEYLAPLYENIIGKCVLTVALILIIISYIYGEKMMDVNIDSL